MAVCLTNPIAITRPFSWTVALEEYFGVVPCTVMSMSEHEGMSQRLRIDIAGVALCLLCNWPLKLHSQRSARLKYNYERRRNPTSRFVFIASNLPTHFSPGCPH